MAKLPVTDRNLLGRVPSLYETSVSPADAIINDNGRKFRGRPEHHPSDLILGVANTKRRPTRVRMPPTSGFIRAKGSPACAEPSQPHQSLPDAVCPLARRP